MVVDLTALLALLMFVLSNAGILGTFVTMLIAVFSS